MAPRSSTLAWKIPWTEEPGRLQSMGSRRVGHDWATSLSLFTFMHWRRKWQPTPVFLPGESQGQQSLVGCRLWGRTESDTTEATKQQQQWVVLSSYLVIYTPRRWEQAMETSSDSHQARQTWHEYHCYYPVFTQHGIFFPCLLKSFKALKGEIFQVLMKMNDFLLCDNLEGWDGVGGGREESPRGRGYMCTSGWLMLMYGRSQNNIVKQLSSN